jgi:hypothetical protein
MPTQSRYSLMLAMLALGMVGCDPPPPLAPTPPKPPTTAPSTATVPTSVPASKRDELKALRAVLALARRTLEDATPRDKSVTSEFEEPANDLCRAYAKAGEVDEALEVAVRLPRTARLQASCRVALERSRAGDPRAGALFSRALVEADNKPDALGRVAFYLMHAGRTDEARAVLDRIDGPTEESNARVTALSAQVRAGDLAGAEETLRAFDGPTARKAVQWGQVSSLAYAEARARDAAAAMRSVDYAVAHEEPQKRQWQRDWTLSRIADGQASRGDADAAAQTAASIVTPELKRRAQLGIAAAQARGADKEAALRTLKDMSVEGDIELEQKLIAFALAGKFQQAMQDAAHLQTNGSRLNVYRQVWLAATRTGDSAVADEAEHKIRRDFNSISAALFMARLQREAGLVDSAQRTLIEARQKLSAKREDHAYLDYWQVGLDQTLCGDADGAIAWAADEPRARCRVWAFLGIAEALGQQAGLRPFSNDGT